MKSKPPISGLFVLLQADPNCDFPRSEHRGSVRIRPRWVAVGSLLEARQKCEQFRGENELGSGNWTAGRIVLDGVDIAQVSYNGRIWEPGKPGQLTPEVAVTADPQELRRRFC